jgi:hypothetical protein
VEVNMAEPVLLEVEPNENVEILLGEKKVKLGQIRGYSESEKITYVVRVKDGSQKALLRAFARSQKAGIDTKEIKIE